VRIVPREGSAFEPAGWQIFRLPLDRAMLDGLRYADAHDGANHAAAFWRGDFDIREPGDTFLDMRPWGKGVVWVNGHCLGRFWNIGPQQTMYLPGPWLRQGHNEIVVFDLIGPQKPEMAGLAKPILDQLRPELDVYRNNRTDATLKLDGAKPVHEGSFPPGSALQEVRFAKTVEGRQLCFESLSAQDGRPFAAIAELDVLDADGKSIPHAKWCVAYADSEEMEKEDGSAENAIDGQTANYWHTRWSSDPPNHPHQLVIDFGESCRIGGIRYLPRSGAADAGGRIKEYRIYVTPETFVKQAE
jgi:beta-galactosidase